MAAVGVGANHALAQQAYRSRLTLETELRSLFLQLANGDIDTEGHIGVVHESPATNRGTNEKYRFQGWNRAPMPKGKAELGKGGKDDWFETSFDINYLALASRDIPAEQIDQNRVDFSIKDSAQIGMAKDAATILEYSHIHQLAGYTPVNASTYTVDGISYVLSGLNPVYAPDSAHHFMCPDASGDNTTEAQVAADPTAVMTSRVFDSIIMKVRSRNWVRWPLAPANTPWGDGLYVAIGDGEFLTQMKSNTSDSDIYDLSRAEIQGGADAMGITTLTNQGFRYKDTIFLESDYMPFGCSGETPGATTAGTAIANVKRAVLLGAGAFDVRYGEGYTGGNHLGYVEDQTLRQLTMVTDTVMGVSKRIVDSQAWGCCVISHYSSLSDVTVYPYR